jgi:serine/threonine protein kinase/Tol biopolymer transport system component
MSMIGKTLAHYEIMSQLGKGGMGEVYQAKDRKLERDVAIKVLPEEFAKDADRVARFQREAKLLASLNHPSIAAIYGLEVSDQTNFLVLELVEGETLANQIKKGPIPVEESLKLALQIAEALEAAHEKGVIHRDLKPANIKVTPDGKVKVLDFGLAKAFAGEQAELNLSNSPTLSNAATQQGIILGTAAYMSPEQARGKPVDKRTDIWAFGCVLYERLTGKAAFQGEDVTEILAAVVKSGVNLDLLPENIHPRVREVIIRCLQKDQKKRYPEINQAHYEIEQVLTDPSGLFVQPVTTAKPRKKLRVGLPWVAVAVVLVAIVAALAGWNLKPPEPRPVTRFEYELPEGHQLGDIVYARPFAVSPDGRQLVYATPKGLYVRPLDQLTTKLIPGTEGATEQPFFSPDGKWIGYSADRQLKKIAIGGGAPVTLCSITNVSMAGASWGTDDTIVYAQYPGDIMRVPANGGNPKSIIKKKGVSLIYPQMLPDGKSVLYTDINTLFEDRVMIGSIESGESRELFKGIAVGYLPTGHIIYGLPNDINLYAIPFDLDSIQVKGGSIPILEGVAGQAGIQFAISNSGTLIYIPATGKVTAAQYFPIWIDLKGKEQPLAAAAKDYSDYFRISPDGTRVAFTITVDGNQDIWVWDLARDTMTRLTFDDVLDGVPVWTPDSRRIVFISQRGTPGLYWKAADGTGEVEQLFPHSVCPWSWSGDGKTLVFDDRTKGTEWDLGAFSLEGKHEKTTLLQEKNLKTYAKISPGGRWMAYQSNESGKWEIYVRPFPEVNKGKWQVSTNGGNSPLWSPGGREIYYRNGDATMAVVVETEPTFKPGNPKILFRGNYVSYETNQTVTCWDIHPDGKRFLMLKRPQETSETSSKELPRQKFNIVLNWYEELKQRVPTK